MATIPVMKYYSKIILLLLLILSMGSKTVFCQAENTTDSETTVPLIFDEADPLNISIALDLKRLLRDVSDTAEYHEGILSYIEPAGDTVTLEVEVRTRGNFRRDKANCDFPPLRLKIPKKSVRNTIFDGQRKLKLVSHCQSDDPDYMQQLYQEYLVYRLYNLITPFGYRVRLLDIKYVDLWDPRNIIKSHAFVLESDKGLEKRVGGNLIESERFPLDNLNTYQYTLLSLFQFMVINNDWSVPMRSWCSTLKTRIGSSSAASRVRS